MFVFSTIRYGIGTDYFYTYVPAFIVVKNGSYNYYEPIFAMLNKFCTLISDNYQIVFIMTSFIIYGILFALVSKFSVSPRYSILIYYASSLYFNSLSNIRQAIAMLICVVGIEVYLLLFQKNNNVLRRDSKKYRRPVKYRLIIFLGFVFVGYMIHSSAIVMIIVPLLSLVKNIKIKKHIVIAFVMVVVAVILNYVGVISNALSIALNLLARYRKYRNPESIYWSFLLLNLVIYVLMYLSMVKVNQKDVNRANFYINLQFCAVIILIFSNIIPLSERLATYFMIVQIVSIPYCVSKITNAEKKQMIIILFAFIYIAWILFYIFSYGADGCFPYTTVFSIDNMWQKGYFGDSYNPMYNFEIINIFMRI